MREQAMFFGDRPLGGRRHKVGTYVEVEDNREVVKPIYIYVGPKALEVKK